MKEAVRMAGLFVWDCMTEVNAEEALSRAHRRLGRLCKGIARHAGNAPATEMTTKTAAKSARVVAAAGRREENPARNSGDRSQLPVSIPPPSAAASSALAGLVRLRLPASVVPSAANIG
jgi:hypothetical protein